MMIKYCISTLLLISFMACNRNIDISSVEMIEYQEIDKDRNMEYQYALTEATKQELLGNHKQAASLYRKCIESNENGDAAMYQLSKIYFRYQDKENSIKYAKKALQIDSLNFWYLYHLAQLYLFFYENNEAINVYEKIIRNYLDKYEVKYELAILYFEMGLLNKSLKIWEELQNEFGINEDFCMKKHQIYIKQNNFNKAEEEIFKLINMYPEEIKYYGILAELYSNYNMDTLATTFYKKIFDIEEDNGLAQLSYAQYLYSRDKNDSAFIYYKKAFNNKEVRRDYKIDVIVNMLADNKKFMQYHENVFELLKSIDMNNEKDVKIKSLYADYYYRIGDYEEAISYLKDVIKISMKSIRAWDQLLYLLNVTENYEELEKYANDALTHFKKEERFYMQKAIAEIKLKEHNEAILTLEKGKQFVENNNKLLLQYYTLLGECYNTLKDYKNSDIAYEKAIEINPQSTLVLNNYSYFLSLREEKLDKALKMIKEVIKMQPENANYLDTYAWVLYKMKKYKKAKKYIEESIKNGGHTNANIIEHYADILYVTGDEKKALHYWKEAKRMGSESKSIESKIKESEKDK